MSLHIDSVIWLWLIYVTRDTVTQKTDALLPVDRGISPTYNLSASSSLPSYFLATKHQKAATPPAFYFPVTSPTRDASPRTVLSCPFPSVSSPGVIFKQSNIHTWMGFHGHKASGLSEPQPTMVWWVGISPKARTDALVLLV